MWVTSWPRRTDNVNAPGLEDERRARKDPSLPRSSSNCSASTPVIAWWNHLGNERETWEWLATLFRVHRESLFPWDVFFNFNKALLLFIFCFFVFNIEPSFCFSSISLLLCVPFASDWKWWCYKARSLGLKKKIVRILSGSLPCLIHFMSALSIDGRSSRLSDINGFSASSPVWGDKKKWNETSRDSTIVKSRDSQQHQTRASADLPLYFCTSTLNVILVHIKLELFSLSQTKKSRTRTNILH